MLTSQLSQEAHTTKQMRATLLLQDTKQKQTMYEASYDQTMIYLDETLPPQPIANSSSARTVGSGSIPMRQAQRYKLSDLRYLGILEIRLLEQIVL